MSISPSFRFDRVHKRICVSMGMERKVEGSSPIAKPYPPAVIPTIPSRLAGRVPICSLLQYIRLKYAVRGSRFFW